MTNTITTSDTPPETAAAILRQMDDPAFVASLSEERVAQLRKELAPTRAWHPWVFNSLTALLIMAGCAILATTLPVPLFVQDSASTWGMPLGGMVVGLMVLSLLSVVFHGPVDLLARLTPLSNNYDHCRQALDLVQSSQLCKDYQARVLAHPREFLVADLLVLETLAQREKEDNATRERQQVCAALHQLDIARK